ncbi:hypothetical protein HMPREF0201_01371 [Cedecea davisae DSM 4568]|uniref:Uncharacterized protein n=1 Tax=Cedecea davisae DSM 4568 TaxID=566551 RepID=S3J224_9ENTR|nr:hypothetical protein HMPREF0201_01371 [Cedecea davisae DSM 4568]
MNVLLFVFMTYALLMLFNDGTANTLSRLFSIKQYFSATYKR